MYFRINISGRLEKPFAPAVQTKLTAAQAVIADVKTYCQKINSGLANEEYSIRTDYDNQAGWIDFKIDLSIPENPASTLILSDLNQMTGEQVGGIRITSAVVPKLANLRTKVKDFKQYLSINLSGRIVTEVYLCNHDDQSHLIPDGQRIEI